MRRWTGYLFLLTLLLSPGLIFATVLRDPILFRIDLILPDQPTSPGDLPLVADVRALKGNHAVRTEILLREGLSLSSGSIQAVGVIAQGATRRHGVRVRSGGPGPKQIRVQAVVDLPDGGQFIQIRDFEVEQQEGRWRRVEPAPRMGTTRDGRPVVEYPAE